MRVLCGDIGGTNARLAVAELSDGGLTLVAQRTVPVREAPDGLAAPLAGFLNGLDGERPRRACLGVPAPAGPTTRQVEGVNLPFPIDAAELEQAGGLERVRLVNDFYAAARGVRLVPADELLDLGGPAPDLAQPQAVIGAGTGLGQAFLLPEPAGRQRVVSTEGGHRAFGPGDALQDRLLSFVRERHGHVSSERVLSGPGLATIYSFLVEREGRPPCPQAEAERRAGRDLAPAVSEQGLAGRDPTARAALEVFVDIYGDEAGNAALTVLATGGVFLAGGIAPRLFQSRDLRERFRAAFEAKGRFRGLLETVPVRVILSGALGLLGAAAAAGDAEST